MISSLEYVGRKDTRGVRGSVTALKTGKGLFTPISTHSNSHDRCASFCCIRKLCLMSPILKRLAAVDACNVHKVFSPDIFVGRRNSERRKYHGRERTSYVSNCSQNRTPVHPRSDSRIIWATGWKNETVHWQTGSSLRCSLFPLFIWIGSQQCARRVQLVAIGVWSYCIHSPRYSHPDWCKDPGNLVSEGPCILQCCHQMELVLVARMFDLASIVV